MSTTKQTKIELHTVIKQYPHCDPRVLHAPGECEICDEHCKEWQELRSTWGIAFTGHEPRNGEFPDPATRARGNPHVWGGNRPWKPSPTITEFVRRATEHLGRTTVEFTECLGDEPNAAVGEFAAHQIIKCTCGEIILQCRCLGPHTIKLIPRGCLKCNPDAAWPAR